MMMTQEHNRISVESGRLQAFLGALALLWLLPNLAEAGLYTSPSGPTDNVGPESAYMNPAGMTGVKTTTLSAGVGGVIPVARFSTDIAEAGGGDGGNSGVASVLPSFYVVTPIADRFRLGFSVVSPVGGPDGLGWDFGDNWAGRYGSQGVTFASTGFSLSGAWQVTDKWSLGVGGTANWLKTNLSGAVDTPFAGDGKADFQDLSDWSARYFVGTQYQVSPTTLLGLVYRSEWDSNVSGDRVDSGPNFPSITTPVTLNLVLPQQVQFGIQHALSKTLILGLNFDWTDWSAFEGIGVDLSFEDGAIKHGIFDINWRDTYSAGASLTQIVGGGRTFVNFGLNYSSSPVSDSERIILLPLDESVTLSLGVAHNASKTLTYSLGGAVVFSGSADVDQISQGVRFKGDFDTNVAFVLGASLQWQF
jgi:long-chain fatty acid transport protein